MGGGEEVRERYFELQYWMGEKETLGRRGGGKFLDL